MMRYPFIIATTCLVFVAQGQTKPPAAIATSQEIQIGNREVRVNVERFGNGGPIYINVHENESTSVEVARQILAKFSGTLVTLRHGGGRFVNFRSEGMEFVFDPNRIYTLGSIEKTLRNNSDGRFSKAAEAQIQLLADTVRSNLEMRPTALIIALHNNAVGKYSFKSYVDGNEKQNAQKLNSGLGRTSDAFFLVTWSEIYDWLSNGNFNVVLQSEQPSDDGSLSVWAQKSNRKYVNVEAKLGNSQVQREMFESLADMCATVVACY